METQLKVCSHCGSSNQPSSRYCDQCGSALNGDGNHPSAAAGTNVEELNAIVVGWTAAYATDSGLVRKNNEDAWFAGPIGTVAGSSGRVAGLFLVADGMGGAAAGEVASRMAIDLVAGEFSRSSELTLGADGVPDWEVIFENAVEHANQEIYFARRSAGNDMGTTLVGALVTGESALIANVGDSRAYHISQKGIRQVTRDHSLVQGLADRGEISREEMRTHPQRNLILRSLGGQAEMKADIYWADLEEGDWLLLCSDGLWEMATEEEIFESVLKGANPNAACQTLINCANDHGGQDNITVVLVRREPAREVARGGGRR